MGITTDISVLRSLIGPYNDLLSGDNSFYIPTAMPAVLRMALQAMTRVSMGPRTIGNQYGQMYTFEIRQEVPEIKRLNLNFAISAITHNGTYCYLTENFLQQIISLLEYKDPNYGSLQTYVPEKLVDEFRTLDYTNQLDVANKFLLGLSIPARATLASTGFIATIPLSSWISERPGQLLRAQNLDSPMQIQLTVAPLNSLVNTDATTITGTITLTMTLVGRIPTEAERQHTSSIINTMDGQLMQMQDFYYQVFQRIPAGTTGTVAIPIDAIKGPVWELVLFFRAWNDVNGSGLTPVQNEYTNFLPAYKPYSIQIKTGNEYICQTITTQQLIGDERGYNYPSSVPESDLVRVSFADCPEKINKIASGYLDFNYLGKPQIELTFNTATPVDISFGILAKTTAFIQHARGTIRAVSSN